MSNGFLAMAGMNMGPLAVTRGLGSPGYAATGTAQEDIPDTEIEGARGPRTVESNRDAPRYNIYYPKKPKAKK